MAIIYFITIREGCRENEPNRDGKLPQFPLKPDLRSLPTNIFAGNQVLRQGLQKFLEFQDLSLEINLNETINRSEPYIDEYGQVITTFLSLKCDAITFFWLF